MAAEHRAIYYSYLAPMVGTRDEIDRLTFPKVKGSIPLSVTDPYLRLTSSGVIYEVWGEMTIPTPYPVLRGDGSLDIKWTQWSMKPGDALRPVWRAATLAERKWVVSARKPFLPDDFAFFNNRLYARIMMHFDDLLALIRQLLHHIPVEYLGERLEIRGESLATQGSSDAIRTTIELLQKAESVARRKGASWTERSVALASIGIPSSKTTSLPVLLAGETFASALSGKTQDQVLRSIVEAESALTEELIHQGNIVLTTLDNALAAVKMYWKIKQGFDTAFTALLSSIHHIESCDSASASVKYAHRLDGLWARFVRVCPFNPHRSALFGQRKQGRGIHLASISLRRGDKDKALAQLRRAEGALRKLAIGEAPRPGDITRQRRRATRAFPEAEALRDV